MAAARAMEEIFMVDNDDNLKFERGVEIQW
jgi:hypothetical protein